jgi:phage-related protein
MSWTIDYPYLDVEDFILKLPAGLSARYFHLTDLIIEFGPNLGMPHTKSLSDGLFELRIKGKEGIVRVFFCTRLARRVVMLHGFVKKTQKLPLKEIRKARLRLSEIRKNETQ